MDRAEITWAAPKIPHCCYVCDVDTKVQATLQIEAANVCCGSNSDFSAPEREVRFVPINSHRQRGSALPSATSGSAQASLMTGSYVAE